MAMLNDILVDDHLHDCVSIRGPEALQEEFMRMPADVAYWNERANKALRSYLDAEVARKHTAARLYAEEKARLILGAAGGKAPTVGDIESAIECHPDLVVARQLEIETEAEKERLRGVMEALRVKRDMIIQLGSMLRIEMERDPVIREDARVARLGRKG